MRNQQETKISELQFTVKKQAIIYDRASSQGQKDNWSREDAINTGSQLAVANGFENWELRQEIVSGEELTNRPVMKAILEKIDRGEVGAIIVQNFSRLSRDEDSIDGQIIKKACKLNDVIVITPPLPGKIYDFSNDQDDKLSDIELMVAKWYKQEFIKYTMQGMSAKAKAGGYCGGAVPIGYKLVYPPTKENERPVGDYAIDEDYRETMLTAFNLYIELENAAQAAKKLNELGYRKPSGKIFFGKDILSYIRNSLYCGLVTWGRNYAREESRHLKKYLPEQPFVFRKELQIVSIETWERANGIRKSRTYSTGVPGKWAKHAFSGVLACPYCGGTMHGKTHTDRRGNRVYKYIRYGCYSLTYHEENQRCKGKHYAQAVVAKAVIPFVAEAIKKQIDISRALSQAAEKYGKTNVEADIEQSIKAKKHETQEAKKRVVKAIATGVLTEQEAAETLTELREKEQRLDRQLLTFRQKEAIREDYQKAVEILKGSDIEEKLWEILENNPIILKRLLSLIIKPCGIMIRTEGHGADTKSYVEKCDFTEEFEAIRGNDTFESQWVGIGTETHYISLAHIVEIMGVS